MSAKDGAGGKGSPEVVDFDALRSALGDLPPPPKGSNPVIPAIAESHGRPNATYASSRPHSVPPARQVEPGAINQPAVIVTADDTIRDMPPLGMTPPMGQPHYGSSPPPPLLPSAGRPYAAASPGAPAPSGQQGPHRPVPTRPRRPRSPTMIVRRGPTRMQKVLVFLLMLLVFVAGGIAFLLVYRPNGIDLPLPALRKTNAQPVSPPPQPTPVITAVSPSSLPAAPPSITPSASVPPVLTASAVPTPSQSVKKPPRR